MCKVTQVDVESLECQEREGRRESPVMRDHQDRQVLRGHAARWDVQEIQGWSVLKDHVDSQDPKVQWAREVFRATQVR